MKSISNQKLWVVTDLDGTLMDHNYDITPAIKTIEWLQQIKIPIIPCTSKTASEVKNFRIKIGLDDPYIVENGGAVYCKSPYSNKEHELILGRSYWELKEVLNKLSSELNYSLKAFTDLSESQIKDLTGLDTLSIIRATDRQWSVPFLNPPERLMEQLFEIVKKYKASIFQGNRMSHLVDINSNKGRAISELKKYLNQQDVIVIGLGDSPNDLPLLEAADFSIVIPGPKGPNKDLIERIDKDSFQLSPYAHATGWAFSVRKIVNDINDNLI